MKIARLGVLTLLLCLPLGLFAQNNDTIKKLEAKVGQLENKVRALESRLVELEKSGPAGERAAQVANGRIMQLVNQGKHKEAKAQIALFQQEWGHTNVAKQASRVHKEVQTLGKKIPKDWGITKWFQGEGTDLSGKKATLVVFWEQWCPHCIREAPKLETLWQANKDKLLVLGLTRVTKSSTDEKVAKYLKDKAIQYPVAKENGKSAAYFNVSGIPAAAFVVNGEVVWRGHPSQFNQAMLTKLLAKK